MASDTEKEILHFRRDELTFDGKMDRKRLLATFKQKYDEEMAKKAESEKKPDTPVK